MNELLKNIDELCLTDAYFWACLILAMTFSSIIIFGGWFLCRKVKNFALRKIALVKTLDRETYYKEDKL